MRGNWLTRTLFALTLSLAASLLLLVMVAPRLAQGVKDDSPGGTALLILFGQDPVVRRTSVASAIGLVVTACVFFRTASGPSEERSGPGAEPEVDPTSAKAAYRRPRANKSGIGA
jgi:hypothetical protein